MVLSAHMHAYSTSAAVGVLSTPKTHKYVHRTLLQNDRSPPKAKGEWRTFRRYTIHDQDQCIVLASDGLFEVLTDEEVLSDVVGTLRKGEDAGAAVDSLHKLSRGRWMEQRNLVDDISVILCVLRWAE